MGAAVGCSEIDKGTAAVVGEVKAAFVVKVVVSTKAFEKLAVVLTVLGLAMGVVVVFKVGEVIRSHRTPAVAIVVFTVFVTTVVFNDGDSGLVSAIWEADAIIEVVTEETGL